MRLGSHSVSKDLDYINVMIFLRCISKGDFIAEYGVTNNE